MRLILASKPCSVAVGRRVTPDSLRQKQIKVNANHAIPSLNVDMPSPNTPRGGLVAKAKGKLLGRPKGALGKSRLDGKEQDIRVLLGKEVSKASIAKILDVSRSALYHFIQTRKIAPG